MVKLTIVSLSHLLLGDGELLPARACQGLFLLCLGFVLVRWRRWPRGPAASRAFVITSVAALYLALMFRVGSRSVISYGARMFLPVLPFLLLLLGTVVAPAKEARSRLAVLVGCGGYELSALLNAPPARSGHLEVASRLARLMSDGAAARVDRRARRAAGAAAGR